MAKEENKQIILDNRFFVPPTVIDVRAAGDTNGAKFYDVTDVAVEAPTLSDPTANIPMPPSSYEIVEQHVRISSDGRAVVDVMLEFPDTPGVETIDVRVTKA